MTPRPLALADELRKLRARVERGSWDFADDPHGLKLRADIAVLDGAIARLDVSRQLTDAKARWRALRRWLIKRKAERICRGPCSQCDDKQRLYTDVIAEMSRLRPRRGPLPEIRNGAQMTFRPLADVIDPSLSERLRALSYRLGALEHPGADYSDYRDAAALLHKAADALEAAVARLEQSEHVHSAAKDLLYRLRAECKEGVASDEESRRDQAAIDTLAAAVAATPSLEEP